MRKDAIVKQFPFSELARETLEGSGISQEEARHFGITEIHPPASVAIYKSLKLASLPGVGCLSFPYYDISGGEINFKRYKPLYGKQVEVGGWQIQAVTSKLPKYIQEGAGCKVYLPQFIMSGGKLIPFCWEKAIEDKSWPLYLLEGEKKAIAGMLRSLVCAAIGGVDNWQNLRRGEGAIPELLRLVAGRQVYLCFDIDEQNGWFKDSVRLALEKLCHVLINSGAFVNIVVLPSPGSGKVGLDDWLLTIPRNEPAETVMDSLRGYSYMASSALQLLEECSRYVYIENQNAVGERDGRQLHLTRSYRESRNNSEVVVSRVSIDRKTGLPRTILKPMGRADAWMAMGCRPSVKDAVYDPRCLEAITPEGFFNTYTGPPQEMPEKISIEDVDVFLSFIKEFHKHDAEHLLNVYLYPLKFPGAKVFTVPLLKTHNTGTGKSTIPELLGEYCYGTKNTAILTSDKLKDFKPEYVAGKQFCVLDDLNDSAVANSCVTVLNGLVTTKSLTYIEKYLRPYAALNFTNFAGTSNKFLPFKDANNRRLWYVYCDSEAFPSQPDGRPHQIFYDLRAWFADGGGGKLRAYAAKLHDFKDFDPYARPPASDAKGEITELSEKPIFAWAAQLKERVTLYTREIARYRELYTLALSEMYHEREFLSLNPAVSLPQEVQNTENNKVLREISFSRTEFAAAMNAAGIYRKAKVQDRATNTSFPIYILANKDKWLSTKDEDIVPALEVKFQIKEPEKPKEPGKPRKREKQNRPSNPRRRK